MRVLISITDHATTARPCERRATTPPELTPDTLVYSDLPAEPPTAWRDLFAQDRKVTEWDAERGVYVVAYPY